MMRTIIAADLFCGAGGTSTGLVRACQRLGLGLDLLAVNHWPVAVSTHERNHPWARHLCADLASVRPEKVVPGGHLDLLVASPECTHHSVARGGKPCSDQSRASAWHVLHWAEVLRVGHILIENVAEFQSWGPLTKAGRPDKRRKGETFRAFLQALESLGFKVSYRILNAADYGEATTRKRLFIQARRGKAPVWPQETHGKSSAPGLFGSVAPWRAAREIIDWDLPGASIFNRKRPLSPKTLARIEQGLKRFGGSAAEPFLVLLRGTSEDHIQKSARSVNEPLSTLTARGGHHALVEPFIMSAGGPEVGPRPCSEPMNTVLTRDHMALVEPFLIKQHFERDVASVNEPLPTMVGRNCSYLAQPFFVPRHNESVGQVPRVHSASAPLPTLTAENNPMLCEPMLVPYYGSARGCTPISSPMPTCTAKHRFALVTIEGKEYALDIRLRMLQPHELAAAMGFEGYRFAGTKTDQVRQIGNAVSVRTAEALCMAALTA